MIMKGLGSVGFSITQPTLMRRALEAKWAPAATANFCNNYQKSNKNLFKKRLENAVFLSYIFKYFPGDTLEPPPPY